ncbi:hypothetical protein Leryth_014753 [Lithospermum erythrorhizon]|nr:hypothetical protein Leryth_014753 [Lithospermum erythrorhizon]
MFIFWKRLVFLCVVYVYNAEMRTFYELVFLAGCFGLWAGGGTMSRAMLLVTLLIIMIITSQFEWRQQLISDAESTPTVSQKQQQSLKREESVQEKVILSQEKNIQRLNELVRSLREQLRQCRSNNETTNGTLSSLAESVIELERQQILED